MIMLADSEKYGRVFVPSWKPMWRGLVPFNGWDINGNMSLTFSSPSMQVQVVPLRGSTNLAVDSSLI